MMNCWLIEIVKSEMTRFTFIKTGAAHQEGHHLLNLIPVHILVIHLCVTTTQTRGWSCTLWPRCWWTWPCAWPHQPAPRGCGHPGVPAHAEAGGATFKNAWCHRHTWILVSKIQCFPPWTPCELVRALCINLPDFFQQDFRKKLQQFWSSSKLFWVISLSQWLSSLSNHHLRSR